MLRNSNSCLRLLMLLMLALPVLAMTVAKRDSTKDANMARAKARHFYLSAVKNDAEGKSDIAYEMYKRAYEIDSTCAEAALEYGLRRWGMPADTLATPTEKERSRKIARKFFDAYPGDLFPNVLYSNMMQQEGNFDEAIEVLESLHKNNSSNSDILRMLADAYLDGHYFDKAIDAIEAYESAEGESLELLIRKAGMRMAMGDTVGALEETDRMVKKNPGNAKYLILKSQLLQYTGQNDSALATALEADKLSRPGEGGVAKVHIADIYLAMGDSVNYDKATYDALLAEDLDFEIKNEILAEYLQKLVVEDGNRERGDRLFSVLLTQYPHEPELLSLAARYSASKEDYAKAYEEISYAIDLDHRNAGYWDQAMVYALLADDHEKVEQTFANAKQNLHKVPIRLYVLAGADANVAKKPQRAVEIYEEALENFFPGQSLQKPVDIPQLGKYLTLDNITDLISLYQQAGDAYYQLNDRKNAFQCYENSLAIDPENPLTLNNYAYFLIETVKNAPKEDLEKADEMSARAIALEPENATYVDTRAWVLFREGKFQEAKEMQQLALEMAEKQGIDNKEALAEYFSHFGDILFMNGEPEAALEAWEKALEGDPENELLKKKIKHKTFFYE